MPTQELGLLLAHHLLGVDDLHYGWWEGETPDLATLPLAQARFTRRVLDALPAPRPGAPAPRVLDVGCGTGRLLQALREHGFDAEGLSPSGRLNAIARGRSGAPAGACVHDVAFEKFAPAAPAASFDGILFAESFQFVDMEVSLREIPRILRPGGWVVIFDVFRADAEGDGHPADGLIRGGRSLGRFRRMLAQGPLQVEVERDITAQVSPTIGLVGELLGSRAAPAADVLAEFARSRFPFASAVIGWVFRKRIARLERRLNSGLYNRESFERYKTYRQFTLRLPPMQ